MHRCILLLFFAVCGCSTPGALDAKLAPTAGSKDDSLITALRRPPPQRADLAPSVANSQFNTRQTTPGGS
jgi:hypothetical protein